MQGYNDAKVQQTLVQEANTQVHTNGGFMIVVDLNSSEPLFSQLINQIKKQLPTTSYLRVHHYLLFDSSPMNWT
ncbi:hypothetical protein [Psychrosphaera algicola]|uniref:Uncharacterized protein n=1 Tax=Psychrosphaera algicola TaxID=3023714 RepID=A0ABT5FDT3_9GAMM|nr:hypothetical protein [Psychrosphaera sp. G1-22]MDC2889679.1 hypothetical protein [Psychrosphaera sp. G1-22]